MRQEKRQLRKTNKQLETAQEQLETGKQVKQPTRDTGISSYRDREQPDRQENNQYWTGEQPITDR
jgi:flagellin-like hook-associated protein FlgL